jgi:hypothetical protein
MACDPEVASSDDQAQVNERIEFRRTPLLSKQVAPYTLVGVSSPEAEVALGQRMQRHGRAIGSATLVQVDCCGRHLAAGALPQSGAIFVWIDVGVNFIAT